MSEPKKPAKPAKPAATASIQGAIPKLSLDLPLDAAKIKAIQKCVAKGSLKITLTKVDLAGGKLAGGYIYD
jgi:hypothetical protein